MNKIKVQGQGLVEFALILPILLLLFLGIAEGAHVVQSYLAAQAAVREAARYAVAGQPWLSEITGNPNGEGVPSWGNDKRINFILDKAGEHSRGTGYRQIITDTTITSDDFLLYQNDETCDQDTCAGIIGIRAGRQRSGPNDTCDVDPPPTDPTLEWCWGNPGTEGDRLRVELYHNVAIFDPIYEVIVPNGFLRVGGAIVMKNEGGPPIGGTPTPANDDGYPPPPAPGSDLPQIKTQASSYPAGSTAVILLEKHDPNTVYEVWVNGQLIGTVTTDASGNAVTQYLVPPDWPSGSYTMQSKLAGEVIATGSLWVTQSLEPLIVLTGGDVWPYGSIIEYSLVSHGANTTYNMSLNGPHSATLNPLATDNNGNSLTDTYTMEPYTTPWADGEYYIQSEAAGTVAATRTVTFLHGCIKVDQGNCGEEQTLPKMVPINILIDNHALNRAYILKFNGTVINNNLLTNYAGEAYVPYTIPDVPNGVYEITTEDAANPGTIIARTTVNVGTPVGPYIHVLGGYTWPAGSNILFHLRQHTPVSLYDVYWIDPSGVDAPILITADKATDADGNAPQDFTIPQDIQGQYQIVSVEPGGDPTDVGDIIGVSLANVTVTSQAYLEIAEGNPQIPGTTITILVRNHAINNQYNIYVGGGPEANVPGTLIPANPVTTDQNGHTQIIYTIPPNTVPGQSLLVRSYPTNSTNNFVAETTLDLAAADLIITAIDTPVNPKLNSEVPLTITVYNDSPVTITHKSFDVDLYLDPVQTPDLGRTLPPGDRKSWVQPIFPAYGTTILTSSLQIYGTEPHDIWGRVDTSNRISEGAPGSIGENNNLYNILLQASGCEIEYTTNIFDPANHSFYGDADPGVPAAPQPRLRIYTAGSAVNGDDDGLNGHYLAYRTMTATVSSPPVGGLLIDATFDSDAEGFSYLDDTFNGTNNGTFADGSWGNSIGNSGGGLRVQLGGTVGGSNNNPQYNMSGGWRQSFNLSANSDVLVSFKYRLDQHINYEPDEYSLVKLTVDGTEYGSISANTAYGLMVNECTSGCDTGWQTFQVLVPGLSSGAHNFTIGGYNNQKTQDTELTQVYIDDVQVTQITSLLNATFDSDSQGFTYADDTFRGTNNPNRADGGWGNSWGNGGGGLRVQLGGNLGTSNNGKSGGHSYTFNLASPAEVVFNFEYNLYRADQFENNEYGEILFSLDGTLVGQGGNDYIHYCTTDGCQTGWIPVSLNLGTLSAGNHTITLGAYNNRNNATNEVVYGYFDNVDIAMVGASSPGPGTPTSSFEIQARLLATDTAVSGAWGIEVRKGITDTAGKVDLGFSTASGNSIAYIQRANNGTASEAVMQSGLPHPGATPTWIRLVKVGEDFTLYTASDTGSGHGSWGNSASFSLPDLTGEVLAGLFGASLDGSTVGKFDFDNVKICTANTDCANPGDIIYEAPDGFAVGSAANLTGQAFGTAAASSPYHEVVEQQAPQPPAPVTINGNTITLNSSGSGTFNDTGEGYLYAYHQIDGSFDVQIKLTQHQPVSAGSLIQYALAGLEVRADLTADADKIDWTSMYINSTERRLHWLTRQSSTENDNAINTGNQGLPVWLRIIRDGPDFTLYYSYNASDNPPDNSWVEQATKTLANMPDSVYLGLINSSADADDYSKAVFSGYHVCGNQGGIASCGEVREANGMVIIDAGNEIDNIIRTQEWTTTARSGKAGFWIPDNGDTNTGGNYATTSPELQYAVDFTNLGTYYVWILGYSPNSNSNSIHFGLTNSPPASGDNMSSNTTGQMAWFNTRQNGSTRHTIDVTSVGSNNLSVWMREDGFEIYQILLTTDANFTPQVNESYSQSTCSSFGQPDIPPGMRQCTDLITNGDFESGDAPWEFLTLGEQVTRTSTPHYFGPNQNWSLLLPATSIGGLPRQPWVYQDFQMPGWVLTTTATGGTSLIFSAHVAVNPEGNNQPDPLYVTLRDQTGQAHETSITNLAVLAKGDQTPPINPSAPDPNNSEWLYKQINLSDYFPNPDDILNYAGQPLRLFVESPNADGSYSTRFSIDNISFEACTTQPTPENPTTRLGGQVWILRNGTPQPQTGVNVWAYAIDGTLAKTYTIHDTTFNFYNLPADPGGTQYIIYAEYYEDNQLKIASAIRILSPGEQITDVILLLN